MCGTRLYIQSANCYRKPNLFFPTTSLKKSLHVLVPQFLGHCYLKHDFFIFCQVLQQKTHTKTTYLPQFFGLCYHVIRNMTFFILRQVSKNLHYFWLHTVLTVSTAWIPAHSEHPIRYRTSLRPWVVKKLRQWEQCITKNSVTVRRADSEALDNTQYPSEYTATWGETNIRMRIGFHWYLNSKSRIRWWQIPCHTEARAILFLLRSASILYMGERRRRWS